MVGLDTSGPQLYETCPSGQFWKYKAMAIGARSQAAKTYLERKLEDFPGNAKDELIMHALSALQVCALCTYVCAWGFNQVLLSAALRCSSFTLHAPRSKHCQILCLEGLWGRCEGTDTGCGPTWPALGFCTMVVQVDSYVVFVPLRKIPGVLYRPASLTFASTVPLMNVPGHRSTCMLSRLLHMQASQQDGDVTIENVTVGVVGADQPFTVLEGATLQPFVSQLDADQPADAPAAAPADDGAAPMES